MKYIMNIVIDVSLINWYRAIKYINGSGTIISLLLLIDQNKRQIQHEIYNLRTFAYHLHG